MNSSYCLIKDEGTKYEYICKAKGIEVKHTGEKMISRVKKKLKDNDFDKWHHYFNSLYLWTIRRLGWLWGGYDYLMKIDKSVIGRWV